VLIHESYESKVNGVCKTMTRTYSAEKKNLGQIFSRDANPKSQVERKCIRPSGTVGKLANDLKNFVYKDKTPNQPFSRSQTFLDNKRQSSNRNVQKKLVKKIDFCRKFEAKPSNDPRKSADLLEDSKIMKNFGYQHSEVTDTKLAGEKLTENSQKSERIVLRSTEKSDPIEIIKNISIEKNFTTDQRQTHDEKSIKKTLKKPSNTSSQDLAQIDSQVPTHRSLDTAEKIKAAIQQIDIEKIGQNGLSLFDDKPDQLLPSPETLWISGSTFSRQNENPLTLKLLSVRNSDLAEAKIGFGYTVSPEEDYCVEKDKNGKIAEQENPKNPKKTQANSPKDSPSRSPHRIVTGLMPDSDQIRLRDIRGTLQDSRRQFEKNNHHLQEHLSNFSHGLNRSGSGSPFRPCCGNHISPAKEQHHEKSSPSPSKFVITNKRMDDSFGLDPLKISEGNQVAGCSMTDRINKDGAYMDTYLKPFNRSVDKYKDRSNKKPNCCRLDYRKSSLGAAAKLNSNEKKFPNKQKLNNSRQSLVHKRNKSVIA
jgi:hypothetical protein